jgi:hypothetical protein
MPFTPRTALALAGGALLALTVASTPAPRRWEDARPLYAQPPGDPPPRDPPRPDRGPPRDRAAAPHLPAPPPPPRPPSPAERAVLGALRPGARVAAGEVTALEGLRDGFLRVYVRLPEGTFEVNIARAEGTNARPPVAVGPYALYPGRTHIPYPTLEPVLRALAAALVVDPALVPPGLRPLIATEPPR